MDVGQRLLVVRGEDVLRAADQLQRGVRVGLHRHRVETAVDGGGEQLDVLGGRFVDDRQSCLSVGRDRHCCRRDRQDCLCSTLHPQRLAEHHQRGAAEDVFGGVVDAGGDDQHVVEARAEGNARGAGLQLAQLRVRATERRADRLALPQVERGAGDVAQFAGGNQSAVHDGKATSGGQIRRAKQRLSSEPQ